MGSWLCSDGPYNGYADCSDGPDDFVGLITLTKLYTLNRCGSLCVNCIPIKSLLKKEIEKINI